MSRYATLPAKKPANQPKLVTQKETSSDFESPEIQSEDSLSVVTSLTRDSKVTRSNILGLQRTIGNRAVMRLIASTQGPAAKPVSNPTIQRKINFPPAVHMSINHLAATADNKIASSTFKDLKELTISYIRAKTEADEAKYLKKMEVTSQDWKSKNSSAKSSRDKEKLAALVNLDKIVTKELARLESAANLAEVGLTDSFIKELKPGEYSDLITAIYLAKQGQMQLADVYLDSLRKTRGSAVNLYRSNIVRTYIGKIDPALAKAMNKTNFKVGSKMSGLGASFVQTQANNLVGELKADKKKFEDDYGKKMTNETEQLSSKTAMSVFGYKDDAPLNNLAAAGKTLQSGKASQSDSVKTPEGQAAMKSLSGNEMTALVGYTSNLYSAFSNPLRKNAGKADFSKNNLALTQTAISAMNKFKSYSGKVYRHDSIFPGFKELNRPGGVTTDLGFMSTAREQGGAASGGTDHDVLLVLTSKTGKEIAIASIFGGEGEVLFKPGTRFKVIKAASKHPTQGWQNADPEIQTYVNADGKSDLLKMVVIKEEI